MPLAEHDGRGLRLSPDTGVSIHVPLAEHDRLRLRLSRDSQVSIHVPLAEHDAGVAGIMARSTSFNSRAPRGARLLLTCLLLHDSIVSIHVPLAEHDLMRQVCRDADAFQFTCPSRSTTFAYFTKQNQFRVSIHVPLAEHDPWCASSTTITSSFNSRAPRGARRHNAGNLSEVFFVSIHVPLAEHDINTKMLYGLQNVSIHVPLAEHDLREGEGTDLENSFNSRAPRGARRQPLSQKAMKLQFQFTCPSRSTTGAAGVKTD